jgi:hypothetical protein
MRTKKKLKIKETPKFFDKHNKRGNIIEIFCKKKTNV